MEIDVSIIIPVKDEFENVPILADEISQVMSQTSYSWECLWVDDGSRDSTLSQIIRVCEKMASHRYFSLDKNYGQSAAMAVGFRSAEGGILVTMDGDGQNDPADIPLLVDQLVFNKADMINGWRKNRADSVIRKISSRIGNGFRNRLTSDNISDVGCSIRAFRKECVTDVPVFKGMHRFLPTLVRIGGFNRIIEVPVNHRPRKLGKTKYGIQNRLWVGLADTLAVCWMKNRLVFPKTREHH